MENLFLDLRKAMPSQISIRVEVCPFFSQGVLSRVKNVFWARRIKSQANHITGDVHYLALLLDPKRTILTIHDCVNLERLKGLRRWALKKLWFDWPIQRVKVVTVISTATRERLLELTDCPPEKVRVIHNPISKLLGAKPKAFDSSYPVFLHVGTKSNKNLERHVEALAGIPSLLRIIGRLTESQRAHLERFKINYENVYDLSYEGIIAEYEDCDIVLFASSYEGFGLPIVEAQAVGRPVITSHTWSMPEVAGDGALLVDPESVDQIRTAIERLLNEPELRDALVQRGFENVKRFKAERIAEQYAELYREVAQGCGGRSRKQEAGGKWQDPDIRL